MLKLSKCLTLKLQCNLCENVRMHLIKFDAELSLVAV